MKLSMKPPLMLVAVLAVAAVLISGCGSASSTSGKTTTADAGATQTASTSGSAVLIATKDDAKLGAILSGEKDMTVYLFEADKNGKSACDADCQSVWPPVIADGKPSAAPAAEGSKIGSLKLSDGKSQVTYAGHPLYYYVKDTDSEDVYGEGVDSFGAEWYVMNASGAKVEKKAAAPASSSSGY